MKHKNCRCTEHMKHAPSCLTHPGPAGCVEAVARAPAGNGYTTWKRNLQPTTEHVFICTLYIHLLNYLENCAMYTIMVVIWRSHLRPMKLLNPPFWRAQQHFSSDKSRNNWNGLMEKWKNKVWKQKWQKVVLSVELAWLWIIIIISLTRANFQGKGLWSAGWHRRGLVLRCIYFTWIESGISVISMYFLMQHFEILDVRIGISGLKWKVRSSKWSLLFFLDKNDFEIFWVYHVIIAAIICPCRHFLMITNLLRGFHGLNSAARQGAPGSAVWVS